MNNKEKIAILTTVSNFELYNKTAKLFPKDIMKYVIDGRNGMHGIHSIAYMMKKLKGKGIEWLIMADEDVIFNQSDLVFSIIDKMKKNNYSVCGIRDGGVVSHRNYNPYVLNTFFSILNFKEIEGIWNKKLVLNNQKILKNEFKDDLSFLNYSYNEMSLYEPYYCFYLWLKRMGKQFLFLDVKMDDDDITNKVYFQNKLILVHTWYARSYGNNKKHTKRINKQLKVIEENSESIDYLKFKDLTFAIKDWFNKRIRLRIFRLFKN